MDIVDLVIFACSNFGYYNNHFREIFEFVNFSSTRNSRELKLCDYQQICTVYLFALKMNYSVIRTDTAIKIVNIIRPLEDRLQPFNRQIIQFEFSPTWSCVSLTRSTTSSELKLVRFDKMEVNCFQILLVDVKFYL